MPLKITNPSKEAAVLNRWAETVENKLRKIETHPLIKAGFVNTTHSNFPTLYYQTDQSAGTNAILRSKNNFLSPFTVTDNFGNDSTDIGLGIVPLTKGGTGADLSATGGTSQVLKQITTGAVITVGRLAASDLSDTATLGNYLRGNGTSFVSSAIQAGDLPNPSATTLGGIESLAAVSHKWINTISTSGVPSATQPAASDLSDTATSGNVLRGNGTSFISATLAAADLSNGTSGTGAVALVHEPVFTSSFTLTNSSAPVIVLNSDTVSGRDFQWRTNSVNRWILRCSGDAESGSDAGSNLQLNSRHDDGSDSLSVWDCNRATGAFTLYGSLITTTATLTSATPTVGGGKIGLGVTTSATANTTGGGLTLPLLAAGYLVINIGGTAYKIPYYAS